MPEVWRTIPRFPGYEISDHGRVRSYRRSGRAGGLLVRKPHSLKTPVSPTHGYRTAHLSIDGVGITYLVHRLVAEAFLGLCPDGQEVCHNDGNPLNNRLDNLRYDTRQANVHDALRHGSYADQQKLTPRQVRQIRKLKDAGHTCRDLAARFDVSRQLISTVARGISYAHVE